MNRKLLVALALTAITLIAVAFLYVPTMLVQQTVLSVSQIYVDPQGSEVSGEWRGSFWNLLISVGGINEIAGYKQVIADGQKSTVTIGGQTYNLEATASVEIKIAPGQPYLIRRLVEKQVTVAQEAGRTYYNRILPGVGAPYESLTEAHANSLTLRYYAWDEPSWRVYTPFTVTVYKDGAQVGQATLNSEGLSTVQTITTNEGSVRIENLGNLQGAYLSPNTPSQICIFKGYPNMYDWTEVNGIVTYDAGANYQTVSLSGQTLSLVSSQCKAYSAYWYGLGRFYSSKRPVGVTPYGSGSTIGWSPLSFNSIGGWLDSGDTWTYRADPVSPVIASSDKSSLPSAKRSFMSLTEYIESRGISNIATMFQSYQSTSLTTDQGQPAIKLVVPWGAYGTPLVNIRIPTELADTIIERPAMINAKPTAYWESTGNKKVEISGSQRLFVDVKSFETTVSGSTTVRLKCDNPRVGITPLEQIVSLAPGETKTVSFTVTNQGTDQQINDIPITITCHETYADKETGRDTVYATLLQTLGLEDTILNILAVERGTVKPITGLQIQVMYPPSGTAEQKTGFTDTSGKVTFTLTMPQGGGYAGQAAIQSTETFVYRPAYKTVTVQPGINDITLEVEVKGEEYPWWEEYWWLIVLIIVIVIVAIVAIIIYKRRH